MVTGMFTKGLPSVKVTVPAIGTSWPRSKVVPETSTVILKPIIAIDVTTSVFFSSFPALSTALNPNRYVPSA